MDCPRRQDCWFFCDLDLALIASIQQWGPGLLISSAPNPGSSSTAERGGMDCWLTLDSSIRSPEMLCSLLPHMFKVTHPSFRRVMGSTSLTMPYTSQCWLWSTEVSNPSYWVKNEGQASKLNPRIHNLWGSLFCASSSFGCCQPPGFVTTSLQFKANTAGYSCLLGTCEVHLLLCFLRHAIIQKPKIIQSSGSRLFAQRREDFDCICFCCFECCTPG